MQGYIISFLAQETGEKDLYWTGQEVSEALESSYLYQDPKEARLTMARLQVDHTDIDLRVLPVVVSYTIVDRLQKPPAPPKPPTEPPIEPTTSEAA